MQLAPSAATDVAKGFDQLAAEGSVANHPPRSVAVIL